MSKKFKDKRCAYCAERNAVTGDHIFAREFFLSAARANLPQAPICLECNNEKSKLEHYLTAVLPFGAKHKASLENLASMVPKRLGKNARLHRELVPGSGGRRRFAHLREMLHSLRRVVTKVARLECAEYPLASPITLACLRSTRSIASECMGRRVSCRFRLWLRGRNNGPSRSAPWPAASRYARIRVAV